ncbi:MAG TPA: phosphoribosylanthranilate isomerase [Terriglobales bacterium]|nr:phosphoribosylanthranilate isomerase [Terriglobales bacterium]
MKTWIKICGTTNLVDALAATQAGANALGFIFAESPRRIDPEAAADIVQELPEELEKVGVFVNESPEYILQVAREVELTAIQLHGDESPEYVKSLISLLHQPLKILKALPAQKDKPGGLSDYGDVDAVLIDSGNQKVRGGTGKVFDWLSAGDFIVELQQSIPVIIAGGLTPENVAAAVCMFRPFGVDVVTGVERAPGHKDPERLRRFVANVRAAELAGSERKQ